MDSRTSVYLEYPCVICNDVLSRPPVLLSHMQRKHNINLPARPFRSRRPKSNTYRYELVKPPAASPCLTHVACPSCWEHTDNRQQLLQHIMQEHLDSANYYEFSRQIQMTKGDPFSQPIPQPNQQEHAVGTQDHSLNSQPSYEQQQRPGLDAQNEQQPRQSGNQPSGSQDNNATANALICAFDELVRDLKRLVFSAPAPTVTASTTLSTLASRKKRPSVRQKRRDSFVSYDTDGIDSTADYFPTASSVSSSSSNLSFR
ncbi:hypothetical protein BDF20DRAFT_844839 [Mycotypha africana]|uniref:uncharacterized protein n=1 Tax=Mycotypha africana TaxID=64632 RepID=UPI0023002A16|nr:uncharacterized protein BDF20DRAFT_844839 [Mycotypha africana]KAI8991472.1 hypothetical protein BDF20DRAFT_844839 [Mycotypha africana]